MVFAARGLLKNIFCLTAKIIYGVSSYATSVDVLKVLVAERASVAGRSSTACVALHSLLDFSVTLFSLLQIIRDFFPGADRFKKKFIIF